MTMPLQQLRMLPSHTQRWLSPETVVHISMLSDQANVVHDAAAKKCLLPGSVRQRLPPQILQPCHAGN